MTKQNNRDYIVIEQRNKIKQRVCDYEYMPVGFTP